MPRNYKSTAALLKPDPKFGSMLATKIINKIMLDGKKSTAQSVFYEALDLASKKLPEVEPVEIFTQAIENAKPMVEVRSKRVGGANYQVPREVKKNRQQSLAIRWVIDNSRKKKGKPMAQRLAEELVDAYNGTGASVQWKENVHKMADANKAYAHYAR
ncbi:MAG: 30S ribosomal protein S7 [Planctomycetes bacterium]|jgi:small subunit ribosomal protein S7|nr:30S ribosomal protein S7 [Planctomycetota bacterium]MDA0948437.1 30S ribosomal protein S7 [Planctomycetota bacterium]